MPLYSRKELIFQKVKIEVEQASKQFKAFQAFWPNFSIFLYFQSFLIYFSVILQVISPYFLIHFFLSVNYQFHLILLWGEPNLNSKFFIILKISLMFTPFFLFPLDYMAFFIHTKALNGHDQQLKNLFFLKILFLILSIVLLAASPLLCYSFSPQH